jgi:formyl-CoA transferase
VRALEVAGGPAAAFAGLLLAELGHEVVRVERPGGGSFSRISTAVLTDVEWQYLTRRKKGVELDLTKDAGLEAFVALARDADAVVEDLGHGELKRHGMTWRRLRGANRNLVLASISPFGQTGPQRGWQASELVIQASSGPVHSTGWKGERPFKAGGFPAHAIAGINAASAILAARFGVSAGTTKGVHLDISMQETYLHHWTRHIGEWTYTGTKMHRERKGFGHQGFRHTAMAADGWLYLLALYASWDEIALFLGLEEFITPEWQDPEFRAEHWPELERPYHESIASRGRYDWFADASETGYTFAPVHSATDQLTNPQFAARGFLKDGEIASHHVPVPGLPFSWPESAMPNRPPRTGEHNEEILGGRDG